MHYTCRCLGMKVMLRCRCCDLEKQDDLRFAFGYPVNRSSTQNSRTAQTRVKLRVDRVFEETSIIDSYTSTSTSYVYVMPTSCQSTTPQTEWPNGIAGVQPLGGTRRGVRASQSGRARVWGRFLCPYMYVICISLIVITSF